MLKEREDQLDDVQQIKQRRKKKPGGAAYMLYCLIQVGREEKEKKSASVCKIKGKMEKDKPNTSRIQYEVLL